VPDLGDRVPPRDLLYVRPRSRGHVPTSPNAVLLESLLFLHTRRGAAWNENDAGTMAAVKARSWQFAESTTVATDHIPRWLSDLVPGRFRSRAPLLSVVLAAHRAGALGVLVSYTELSSLLDVTPRTVSRWVRDLEADGLLEVIQTWQPAPDGHDAARGYWKHLYRPGPRMRSVAGLGMLEGAAGLGDAERAMAQRCARVARARVRRRQRERSAALWEAEETRRRAYRGLPPRAPEKCADDAQAASPLSLDTESVPPPPTGGRGITPPASRRRNVEKVGAGAPSVPSAAPSNVVPLRPSVPAPPPGAQAPSDCSSRADDSCGELAQWLERAELERERERRRGAQTTRTRSGPCSSCGGSGLVRGVGSPTCPECGGQGRC